jgi:hypothetical protein
LFAALLLATGAHAQTATTMMTINLNVPVQISNYAGGRAAVWCEMLNAAGQPLAPPPTADGRTVGVGTNYVTVNAGVANTSVPMFVSVPRESAPLARGWRCILATTDKYAADPKSTSGLSTIPKDLAPLAEVRGTL